MSKLTQQSGNYKFAICEDCGEPFTYKIPRAHYYCETCTRSRAYARRYGRAKFESSKTIRAKLFARLAAYDAAAPEVKTVCSTARGRVIERRGVCPIASTR